MNEGSYSSNLASEFYVLSCLHRIGLTANRTFGNKNQKGDIIVASLHSRPRAIG